MSNFNFGVAVSADRCDGQKFSSDRFFHFLGVNYRDVTTEKAIAYPRFVPAADEELV